MKLYFKISDMVGLTGFLMWLGDNIMGGNVWRDFYAIASWVFWITQGNWTLALFIFLYQKSLTNKKTWKGDSRYYKNDSDGRGE